MNDEQKSALDKLFDEIFKCGYNWDARQPHTCQEEKDHLRTTFPDRVAEIVIPKPVWGPCGCVATEGITTKHWWIGYRTESYGYVVTSNITRTHTDHGFFKTKEEARIRCEQIYYEWFAEILKPKEGEGT